LFPSEPSVGIGPEKPISLPTPGDIPLPPHNDDRNYYDRGGNFGGSPTLTIFTGDGPASVGPTVPADRGTAQPSYFGTFSIPGLESQGLGSYFLQKREALRKKYVSYEEEGLDFGKELRDLHQLNVPLLIEYLDQKALSTLLNQGGLPSDNPYGATTSTDIMKSLAAAYAMVWPENWSGKAVQPFVQMVVYKSVKDPLRVKAFLFLRVLTEQQIARTKDRSNSQSGGRQEPSASKD
jgi:hypothetical protein